MKDRLWHFSVYKKYDKVVISEFDAKDMTIEHHVFSISQGELIHWSDGILVIKVTDTRDGVDELELWEVDEFEDAEEDVVRGMASRVTSFAYNLKSAAIIIPTTRTKGEDE